MNSFFRLKGKIFRFINFMFYFVIFVIGFICGSMKIDFTKLFSENVYAAYYQGYGNYFINGVNFYLDETQEEYENVKYGFQNPAPYSSYVSRYVELQDNHVFEYLNDITEYLVQNYSNDYDFVVFYNDYTKYQSSSYIAGQNINFEYQTWSKYVASAIYIYYFPKNSLSQYDVFDYGSAKTHFIGNYSGSIGRTNACYSSQGESACSDTYIPGSGLDVIRLSKRNSSGVETWLYTSIYDNSDNFNLVEYLNFEPSVTYYKQYYQDFLNNPSSYFSSQDSTYQQNVISTINRALNDEIFLVPNFDLTWYFPFYIQSDMDNPNGRGWLIFYSTIPVINDSSRYYWVIGSKAIGQNEEIPTYAQAKNLTYEVLTPEEEHQQEINQYFNSIGYRRVCSNSNSVILSRDNSNISNFDIFLDEDPNDTPNNGIIYKFYDFDYANNSKILISPNISTYHYDSGSQKNLFNFDNSFSGYFESSGSSISSNTGRNVVLFIPCLPNTSYHFSTSTLNLQRLSIGTTSSFPEIGVSVSNVFIFDSNNVSSIDRTYTTDSSANYIVIRFQSTGSDFPLYPSNLSEFLINPQLEEGSVATEYEPYRAPSNFSSYLDGKSTFNYSFIDNNVLRIDRTNYRTILVNLFNVSTIHFGSSNSVHGGGGFHVGGINEIQDGFVVGQQNWCFYVPYSIYVSHQDTSLIDHVYGSSDDGIVFDSESDVMTPDGIVHVSDNSYGSLFSNSNSNFFHYTSNFLQNNSNAFAFFGTLFQYFFSNIHFDFMFFCVTLFSLNLVFIIIVYIRGGGNK